MNIFVSSLIRSQDGMESVADWVDSLGDPQIGTELIAFTHDDEYWQRLCQVLKRIHCPITFHGPYIGTEGTSQQGSDAHLHLLESYRRTFELAAEYGVRHVVYHTTQLGFTPDTVDAARRRAEENAAQVMDLADRYKVCVLVENLPYPVGKTPLYTNEQYTDFFRRIPRAYSIIDVGHSHVNGLDIPAFLREHSSRVKAYHFHNNDGLRDQHNDLFHGTFSFEKLAPQYRCYTPDANIVLEYEPHTNLSNQDLLPHIQYLRDNF